MIYKTISNENRLSRKIDNSLTSLTFIIAAIKIIEINRI